MTGKDFYDFNYNQGVQSHARDLQERFKLTDYEALKIAIESQRNEFMYRFFKLSNDCDVEHPSGLEAIAIALGLEATTIGLGFQKKTRL